MVVEPFNTTTALAKRLIDEHINRGRDADGPTLVVLNTVDRAIEVFNTIEKEKNRSKSRLTNTDIRLIHSRFRPLERNEWRNEFLNKDACVPDTDRIIVATQVVEAGVDISAGFLVTELAPWSSLVQRFGRCARRGGRAKVIVADFDLKGDKAKPYEEGDLNAAREALAYLSDVAPLHLETFEEEEEHVELLPRLYPYEPAHLLLRHELDELFDTTPDLTGADIDISRFIRSGEERDLHVFWADIAPKTNPPDDIKPLRETLCAVPFLKARDWLCGKESSTTKAPRLKPDKRTWTWNWLEGQWHPAERSNLYPGQTVLVAADCGGYDRTRGWDPNHSDKVTTRTATPVSKTKKKCWRLEKGNQVITEKEVIVTSPAETADAAQDSEDLSLAEKWKTIAVHGQETGGLAHRIASAVAPDLAGLFDLAGRWHDAGKSHKAFQASMHLDGERPSRDDLAKAPDAAWPCSPKQMYRIGPGQRRPGFRHELASTLALFAVLQRHRPDHPALLGPWRELLTEAGLMSAASPATPSPAAKAPNVLEDEILALDAAQFDLLAYLVCAYHGKLRLAWHACPADQQTISPPTVGEMIGERGNRMRIRGVCAGDELPPLLLTAADGTRHALPATRLDLAPATAGLNPRTGRGWTERVLGLLQRHGPFTLAWLEALLRAADQRASRLNSADPLLEDPDGYHELETSDRTLATADPGGTTAHSAVPDTPQSGPQHGLRGGAGGREDAGSRTRTPHQSTRYLTTTLGILSFTELAPHLSRRVQDLEADITYGRFADRTIGEDLIREFHHHICGDLVPDIAGRWRQVNVRVSDHEAPAYFRIPLLMREYCLDLQARIASLGGSYDDRIPELLAFAEGRLLWIHPFMDFNGRTTRVLLTELLRRLDQPALDPTPRPGPETERYLQALKSADRTDWQPLIAFWLARFDQEART